MSMPPNCAPSSADGAAVTRMQHILALLAIADWRLAISGLPIEHLTIGAGLVAHSGLRSDAQTLQLYHQSTIDRLQSVNLQSAVANRHWSPVPVIVGYWRKP
jgi:hypothetical protein